MSIRPLLVDFSGLKKMGWPYSKSHTDRMMLTTVLRTTGSPRKGTYREWVEPNPRPFPKCRKLGHYPSSPKVWVVTEVLAYLEALGLSVSEDWYAPDKPMEQRKLAQR